MTRKTVPSAARRAAARFGRPVAASPNPRRPASAPLPSSTSSAPASAYPRSVTSETFEAEFVAYNEFRKACGVRTVDHAEFARAVAAHNALIVAGPIDRDAPEA